MQEIQLSPAPQIVVSQSLIYCAMTYLESQSHMQSHSADFRVCRFAEGQSIIPSDTKCCAMPNLRRQTGYIGNWTLNILPIPTTGLQDICSKDGEARNAHP